MARRFFGTKGTSAVIHLDHEEDDSDGYTFYNVAYSHGGDTTTATENRINCRTYDTTSTSNAQNTPFTNARLFAPASGSFGVLQTCNSDGGFSSPYILDVATPSIEAWIKPTSFLSTAGQVIAGYYKDTTIGGYELSISAAGSLTFAKCNGGESETTAAWSLLSYTPGEWMYVAATYDGTICRLYINGELIVPITMTGGDITYGAQAGTDFGHVGMDVQEGNRGFAGEIAALRFSYVPVSPWQIHNTYFADSDPSLAFDATGSQLTYNLDDDEDPNADDAVTDSAGTQDGIVISDVLSGVNQIVGPIGGYTETTRLGHRLRDASGSWTVSDAGLGSTTVDDRTQDMTVEMWVSTDDEDYSTEHQYLIAKRQINVAYTTPLELLLDYTLDSCLKARVRDESATTISLITDHHIPQDRVCYIALTWDATDKELSLYLNGTHIGSAANATFSGTAANGEALRIGHTYDGLTSAASKFFDGQIHKVRISNSIKTGAKMLIECTGFTPSEDN